MVSKAFDSILPDLVDSLNDLHQTTFSQRYWQTATGLWLYYFLDVLYARLKRLESAFSATPISSASILQINHQATCPTNRQQFITQLQSQKWNNSIIGSLLYELNRCEISEVHEIHSSPPLAIVAGEPSTLNRAVRAILSNINSRGQMTLASTYLSRFSELQLAILLKQLPTYWSDDLPISAGYSIAKRQQFELRSPTASRFETIVRRLIPLQLPTTVVEDYEALRTSLANRKLPKQPRLIFTSNKHASSDSFALWSAEKMESGTRLVLGQHGGLYGEGLLPTRHEQHELSICDRYITWGWTDPRSSKIEPGPAFANIGKKIRRRSNTKNNLLYVTDSTLRFGKYCWDSTEERDVYLSDQAKVLSGTRNDIQKQTIIRLQHDHARDDLPHNSFWNSHLPNIAVDDGTSPMSHLRQIARLVICTSLGTTQIETLGQNIPTIIFLNPQIFPLRSDVRELYEVLKSVGIYHESAESTSEQINRIWNDVDAWWNDPRTKDARDLYCNSHALRVRAPIRKLRTMLRDMV
jgi:putative transferase (TIGR04331 family)